MDPLSTPPQPDMATLYETLAARRAQQVEKLAGQGDLQLIQGAAAAAPPMPPGSTISVYA